MAHIWSDNNVTGTTYDGVWNLTVPVSNHKSLIQTFVDDGDIPYLYAGVDGLFIDDGAIGAAITFTAQSGDRDDPAVLQTMQDDINNGLTSAASAVTCDSVTFDAATTEFEWTFSAPVILQWSAVASTANLVFQPQGETGDSANLAVHRVTARYADNRPHLLLLTIDEATARNAFTAAHGATVPVSLQDHHRHPNTWFPPATNQLTMRWSRINAPEVVCPFLLQWFLTWE